MKHPLIAILVLLVLVSCKETITPAPKALIPVKMEQPDNILQSEFDENNRVKKQLMTFIYPNGNSQTSEQYYTYNDDGTMSESYTENGWAFIYHYQNRLVSQTSEYINGHLTQIHEFQYDDRKNVITLITKQDIPEEGGVIPTSKSTYTYDANNNVIQNKLYYYSTGGINETLLTVFDYSGYDNKINTEALIYINPFNPLLVASKNNPGRLEIRNGKGFLSSTNTYTYAYNDQGYVVKKNTSILDSDGTIHTVETKFHFK